MVKGNEMTEVSIAMIFMVAWILSEAALSLSSRITADRALRRSIDLLAAARGQVRSSRLVCVCGQLFS